MRKKLIFTVAVYIIALLSTFILVKAYYNSNTSDYRQQYTITALNFSVNGISAKNNQDINGIIDEDRNTHIVNLTNLELDNNDGVAVDLDLQARGTSNGSYSISYKIIVDINESDFDIAPYIQVFEKINGKYIFDSYLNSFKDKVLVGNVGLNNDKYYNYLFVVSPNSVLDISDKDLSLTFITTYDVAAHNSDFSDYKYYYLSNSFEVSGTSGSVFSKLVTKKELAGKTIVLTSDFSDFGVNENIVLPYKVGIDLNGHTLNMNGASITIKPEDDSLALDKQVYIMDTGGGGSVVNGNIIIDASDDLIKINDSLLSPSEAELCSHLQIVNTSIKKFKKELQLQLDEIEDTILSSNDNENFVELDVTEGLKYYLDDLSNNYFSIVAYTDLFLSESSVGVFTIDRSSNTKFSNIKFTVSRNSVADSIASGSITILGNGSQALADEMIKNFPSIISHSIFLPSYDLSTRTEYKWITSNNDLLDNNGEYLKNGLSNLDSYKNQRISFKLIVEQDGKTAKYEINDIKVVIFNLQERIDILSAMKKIDLVSSGLSDTDSGVYVINSMLKKSNFILDDSLYLDYMLDTYNIVPSGNSIEELVVNADKILASKLGLVSITIPETDTYGAKQINISNDPTDTSYYLTDPNNTSLTNKNYVIVNKLDSLDGYTSFELSVKNLPEENNVILEYNTNYEFYDNEWDTSTIIETFDSLTQITVSPKASLLETFNPISDLQAPLKTYENTMEFSYEEVNKVNSVTGISYGVKSYYYTNSLGNRVNAYKDYIDLASNIQGGNPSYRIVSVGGRTSDLPVSLSTFDTIDEFNNNLTKTTLNIITGLVSNNDEEVILEANMSNLDFDDPLAIDSIYSISFVLPGIINNSSEGVANSNLYFAFLDAADINKDGVLSKYEALNLKDLTFNSSGSNAISIINGIKNFSNLIDLDLSKNEIIDISELNTLTKLNSLNISYNNIVKIDGLKFLDGLRTLNLSDNNIVSIDSIEYLTELETLNLANNTNIKSFSYIKNYQNLKDLYVYSVNSSVLATSTYYFTKIYNNTEGNVLIHNVNDSDYMNITTESSLVAKILDKIVILSETYGNISFPKNYSYNGTDYELIWYSSEASESGNLTLEFTDTFPYYIYRTPSINKNVNISVKIKKSGATTEYPVALEFPVKLLKSSDPLLETYIETSEGNFKPFVEVVPDNILRGLLYENYNDSSDTVTYTDSNNNVFPVDQVISINEMTKTALNLNYSGYGITSLEGIGHFSISILNIRQNNIITLTPLIEVESLKNLTLGGQKYDFDELAYSKDGINKVSNLEVLHLEGTYGLKEDDTLTALYHVYKTNTTDTTNSDSYIKIYFTEDLVDGSLVAWDPFYDQLFELTKQYQKAYNLYELGDSVSIKKTYDFNFYDEKDENGNEIITTFNIPSIYKRSFSGQNPSDYTSPFITGIFTNKIDIITNTDSYELKLTSLPGREGQFIYSIPFSTSTQSVNGTIYNFKTSLIIKSIIHIEYNNSYCVDTRENPDYNNDTTKVSDIFKGAHLLDLAMTAISNVEVGLITTSNGIKILPNSFLTTTLSSIYSNDNNLLEKNSSSYKIDLSCDGKYGINGLRYFTSITVIYRISDTEIGDGRDLINITTMYIKYAYVDFSLINTTLPAMKTIVFDNPYGINLYDKDYYNDTNTSNYNSNIYYLNYFTSLENLSIYRVTEDSPQLYDFRGLRGLIYNVNEVDDKNLIKKIDLKGEIGSSYNETTYILNSIYNNSKYKDSIAITLCNNIGEANYSESFVPEGVVDLNAAAVAEYLDSYRDIIDLGFKVMTSGDADYHYHYQDSDLIFETGDSFDLPGYTKMYGIDIDGDGEIDSDNTVYKINSPGTTEESEENLSSYNENRKFNIDWFVYTRDIEQVKAIIGQSGTVFEKVSGSTLENNGLFRYKITNLNNNYVLDDTIYTVSSQTYDTMFIFEGVIGNRINNIDLSSELGGEKWSLLYPVTISGTAAYNTSNEYEYQIGSKYYYSYKVFNEVELRLAEYLAFSYKDLEASELSSYYSNLGLINSTYGLISKERALLVTSIILEANSESTLCSSGQLTSSDLDLFSQNNSINNMRYNTGARIYIDMSIEDPKGLEIFTNVISFINSNSNVNGKTTINNLSNIEFLKYLPKLATLDVKYTSFMDLSPVKNLTNLVSVNLYASKFSTTYYTEDSHYKSYFRNSPKISSLILSKCPGVTFIDILALKGDVNYVDSGISKFDNKTWINVSSSLKVSVDPNLFDNGSTGIIKNALILKVDNNETSQFVSNFLAMYVLYESLLLDTDYLNNSFAESTTSYSVKKIDFMVSAETVLEAYYRATYQPILTTSTNRSFMLSDGKIPTLLYPGIGTINDSGELVNVNTNLLNLPGAFNIPIKHSVSFTTTGGGTFQVPVNLDYKYYFINTGVDDHLYLKLTVLGQEMTVNTSGMIVEKNSLNKADVQDIFGPTLLEYIIVNSESLGATITQVPNSSTYYLDVTNIRQIKINGGNYFIHSIKGLEYLPRIYYYYNMTNPVNEIPDFSTGEFADKITHFYFTNVGYRFYLRTEDLVKFSNFTNVVILYFQDIPGDYTVSSSGYSAEHPDYSFRDVMAYMYPKVKYVRLGPSRVLYDMNDTGTVDEKLTYERINRMNTLLDEYPLFGCKESGARNMMDMVFLYVEDYDSLNYLVGPVSINLRITTLYLRFVHGTSNNGYYPYRYDIQGTAYITDEDQYLFNYMSIMPTNSKIHNIYVNTSREFLYYKFDSGAVYFLPKQEIFYGLLFEIKSYSTSNNDIIVTKNNDYSTYGIRNTLTIPTLADTTPVNFSLTVNNKRSNITNATQIYPTLEIVEVVRTNPYEDNYVEINDYEISEFSNVLLSNDSRYFVPAVDVFGNGNMLYYVYTDLLNDVYTNSTQTAFWILNEIDNDMLWESDLSTTYSSVNTNIIGDILINGSDVSNKKILDLSEQQAVSGYYNNAVRENDRKMAGFEGFERFVNLKDIYVTTYYSEGLQINAIDLSPLKNLKLRQFYFYTSSNYTSNNFLPLLEGSKKSLKGFCYGSYLSEPTMFDINFLLGFEELEFIYLLDFKPINITSSESYKSFASYLYLYNRSLYNNLFITTNYVYLNTSMNDLTANINLSGNDIVYAEILKSLTINGTEINKSGYVDLSSNDDFILPTTTSLKGVSYNISFESLSSYVTIIGDTLSINNRSQSPGYCYIKVIFRVYDKVVSSKVVDETERIILIKL